MSRPQVTFSISHDKNAPERGVIFGNLRKWTQEQALQHWPQARQEGSVTVTMTDEQGEIVGGCFGDSFLACIFIAILWVHDDYRGKGFGCELLDRIQDEAKNMGCVRAYIDTFDFQAPKLYQKLGFEEFGRVRYFEGGPEKIFLTKPL